MQFVTILSLLILYLPIPLQYSRELPGLNAALGVYALAALNVAGFWAVGRLAVRRKVGEERDLRLSHRFFRAQRWLIAAFILVDAFVFRWPAFVQSVCPDGSPRSLVPLWDDLLLLSPLILMILGALGCQHRIDHARGRTGMPLLRYVGLRFRVEEAIVFVPWLILALASDMMHLGWTGVRWATSGGSASPAATPAWLRPGGAEEVSTFAAVGFLFLFAPVLLARIWKTAPLPEGPLRCQLGRFCEGLKFRCRDILLWRTDHHVGNAAVTGVLPRWRYVILSDLLVETCSDEEIAAIVAHEVGHVKFRHLWFYLVFSVGYLFFYAALQDLAASVAPGAFRACRTLMNSDLSVAEGVLLLVFTTAYWGIVFGYLSRRMELQADLYSAYVMGRPEAFARALEKLAYINGIPPTAGGWRHFSIARRIQLVLNAGSPERIRALILKLNLLKYAFVMLLLAAALRVIAFRGELLFGG